MDIETTGKPCDKIVREKNKGGAVPFCFERAHVMNAESLTTVAVQYWPVLLVVGGLLTFFGYYLLRTSMAVVGFIGGAYLGQYLWTRFVVGRITVTSSSEQIFHIGLILIVGFLSIALFVALYKFAIFASGFIAGGAVAYYAYTWIVSAFKLEINSHTEWIHLAVFAVFGLILGLITLMNEKKAVGSALAAIGALLTSYAVMIPLSGYFKVEPSNLFYSLTDGTHIIMLTVFVAFFLILAIISISFQFGTVRKGSKKEG